MNGSPPHRHGLCRSGNESDSVMLVLQGYIKPCAVAANDRAVQVAGWLDLAVVP
jgi:hypothetical protein